MVESTVFPKRALMIGWINCRKIIINPTLNDKIDILNFFEKMRYGMGRRKEISWIEKK